MRLNLSSSGQEKATCCSFRSFEHRIQCLDLKPAIFGALFPKPAPSASYTAPSSTYSEPEEPALYSPPKSNHPRQANVAREPLLSKFMKDFSKVNNWLARQTLEVANNGVPFEMPFDLPEIPELPNIQKIKREDSEQEGVMKYIPAPDLSKEQEDTEDDL